MSGSMTRAFQCLKQKGPLKALFDFGINFRKCLNCRSVAGIHNGWSPLVSTCVSFFNTPLYIYLSVRQSGPGGHVQRTNITGY